MGRMLKNGNDGGAKTLSDVRHDIPVFRFNLMQTSKLTQEKKLSKHFCRVLSLLSIVLAAAWLIFNPAPQQSEEPGSATFLHHPSGQGNAEVANMKYTSKAPKRLYASVAIAGSQQDSYRRRGGRGRQQSDRSDYTTWEIEKEFTDDVFTFVRIQFDSGGFGRGGGWSNDFPDCDWNFSVRLHELTSLKVDPNGKVVRLTDPELFDYPFVFMSNVNRMNLADAEAEAMRKYCLKGGFVMADDFWAPAAWRHVKSQMKRVFPTLEPRELTRDHEIFNLVYELKGIPQVPSIFAWQQGDKFEYWHGDPEGDEAPHFWGYFDENDRLMALMCHNNDIGDGWEREGENKEYFIEYSERVSYPLGINIVTYVMTH